MALVKGVRALKTWGRAAMRKADRVIHGQPLNLTERKKLYGFANKLPSGMQRHDFLSKWATGDQFRGGWDMRRMNQTRRERSRLKRAGYRVYNY